MDLEAAREFIRHTHRGVLSTYKRDGQVQLSPVIAGIDGMGRAIISTRETAFKVQHVRRDPRVSLCVFADTFFGQWIQIDGTGAILSLPDALEPLVEYYRTVIGEHPDWDEYRRAMVTERRVLLQITIERAGPDRKG